MSYTMDDFDRDYIKTHFVKLTREERQEALALLSAEERREIRQYLEQLIANSQAESRKPRRKR
jgi:hypothetical protein